MKKLAFASIFIIVFSVCSFAQIDTVHLKNTGPQRVVVTDRAPQAVYFQLLGSGPILSVIYDRRFAKKPNGLGFSAGLGYVGAGGDGVFSLPVELNYLFGRSTHFIEASVGTTYVSAAESVFDSDASGFMHHIGIGYRHQPTAGGFFFRGGFSPLIFAGEFVSWPYLGFGYNF